MEAQNEPTPTCQLAPPTWAKSSFFLYWFYTQPYMAICGIFRYVRKKPSADRRENLPPTPKSSFQQVQTYIDPTKKIWTEIVVATLRTTVLKMPSLMFGEIRWVAIFHQNAKVVRFTNSDKIFDSNLFYWTRYTLYFTNIYDISSFLVLTRHFSSFSAFLVVRKKRGKFLKMSSKDEQRRVMTRNHIIS